MNIRFLDGLRGLAAFMVLIGHARLLLWEGYSAGYKTHPDDYTIVDKFMMYAVGMCRYGHEMVVLFFILSGFVIHLRFANRAKRGVMHLKTFWYRRLKRLYPPLLFTFLLAFILDSVGKSYGWLIYFQQTPYPNINRDIFSVTDAPTLLGNLFFLTTVYVPPFGTTIVTWSLMYEWWFYVLYPLAHWSALRFGFRKTTAVIGLLFLMSFAKNALAPALFWKVMDSFIVWWMGACLVEIWVNRAAETRKIYALLPYLTVFLPIALVAKEKNIETLNAVLSFTAGLGFTGLIALLLRLEPQNVGIRCLNWLKPLGDCSYTLYLIHVPFLVFASGFLMRQNGRLPQHLWYVGGGIIGLTGAAYCLHFLIEKPFTRK